jgi:hypothetical protein
MAGPSLYCYCDEHVAGCPIHPVNACCDGSDGSSDVVVVVGLDSATGRARLRMLLGWLASYARLGDAVGDDWRMSHIYLYAHRVFTLKESIMGDWSTETGVLTKGLVAHNPLSSICVAMQQHCCCCDVCCAGN